MERKRAPIFVSHHDQLAFVVSKTALMQEAVSLLSPLGISSFYYFRIYQNGRYLHLGNDESYMRFYVHNVHRSPPLALDMIAGNYTHYIWPLNKRDFLVDAANAHGFGNGISIIRYAKDHYECWCLQQIQRTQKLSKLT